MKSYHHFLLLLLLNLLCLFLAQQISYSCDELGFVAFQKVYGKTYSSLEWAQRLEYFTVACEKIELHNSQPDSTFTMAINQFADLSPGEFNSLYGLKAGGATSAAAAKDRREKKALGASELPPYLNYYSKGYVEEVKDQGYCGSCWAFAGTALYESKLRLFGYSFTLSEEAALQCTNSAIDSPSSLYNSCDGGYLDDILSYYNRRGGVLSSKYPYVNYNANSLSQQVATSGICSDDSRIKLGQGEVLFYYDEGLTDLDIKDLLVKYGPLLVGVNADSWSYYSSGVFSGCSPSGPSELNNLNHAVLLYGWDTDGNWFIKNSWGTDWGENGFMKIAPTRNCGINLEVGTIKFGFVHKNPLISLKNEMVFTSA